MDPSLRPAAVLRRPHKPLVVFDESFKQVHVQPGAVPLRSAVCSSSAPAAQMFPGGPMITSWPRGERFLRGAAVRTGLLGHGGTLRPARAPTESGIIGRPLRSSCQRSEIGLSHRTVSDCCNARRNLRIATLSKIRPRLKRPSIFPSEQSNLDFRAKTPPPKNPVDSFLDRWSNQDAD